MQNAFESRDRKVLPEMLHSEFLGVALRTSLNGDRSLFDEMWERCAPDDWACPRDAWVETEHGLLGARRIDILIGDPARKRVIGIEVKTRDQSVQPGQLEAYRRELCEEYGEDNVAMVFLTPFNGPCAEKVGKGAAELLRAVDEFDAFSSGLERVCHVSWREVAGIAWKGGGDLWSEHQAHVIGNLACERDLGALLSRSRSFSEFFGEKAEAAFRESLPTGGAREYKGGVVIDLKNYDGTPHELAEAFRILIKQGEGVVRRSKGDDFPETLRQNILALDQDHRKFHEALFALADQYKYVWLDGTGNYGLRVRHRCENGSVSLVTSRGCDKLLIGQRR